MNDVDMTPRKRVVTKEKYLLGNGIAICEVAEGNKRLEGGECLCLIWRGDEDVRTADTHLNLNVCLQREVMPSLTPTAVEFSSTRPLNLCIVQGAC